MNGDKISDAELIAMSVVAFADCVEVLAANQDRSCRGDAMAYSECNSDNIQALRDVLVKRKMNRT